MSGVERFRQDWRAWHAVREERLVDPAGFLAVTGLHWLGAEEIRPPDAPGAWRTSGDGPVVRLGAGERLVLDGAGLGPGEHRLGPVPERGSVLLGFEDDGVAGVLEVARRGGVELLRPRRADHAFLTEHPGTPTFAPDPAWVVPARYVAFDEPVPTEVGAAVEGLRHVYEAPGRLEFTLGGQELSLVAFPGFGDGSLHVLFTDATSGVSTYAANRSLSVPAPDADGVTVLDFTRAVNLPCAYTDYATCPLPPAGNRLPVAIEAGERTPLARVRAAVEVAAPH